MDRPRLEGAAAGALRHLLGGSGAFLEHQTRSLLMDPGVDPVALAAGMQPSLPKGGDHLTGATGDGAAIGGLVITLALMLALWMMDTNAALTASHAAAEADKAALNKKANDVMASPGATWQHKLRNYVNTPIFEARRKLLVTSTRAPAPPKEE